MQKEKGRNNKLFLIKGNEVTIVDFGEKCLSAKHWKKYYSSVNFVFVFRKIILGVCEMPDKTINKGDARL